MSEASHRDNEKAIELSVIVPVYNVEPYFAECLDALLAATEGLLSEILLIDDGSTDNSSQIAEAYRRDHARIRIFRREHQGVSDARNFGVTQAKGTYLAFADADDLVRDSIYRDMLYVAKRNNTAVTICNVTRLREDGQGEVTPQYQWAFNGAPQPVSSILERPALLYDTAIWNKLILRSFWEEHHFRFPEGMFYEDLSVALDVLLKAGRVSVLYSFLYNWRIRAKGAPSTTQRLGEPAYLRDRIKACDLCLDLLEPYPPLHKNLLRRIAKWDFEPFVLSFHKLDEDAKKQMIDTLASFLEEKVPSDATEGLQRYQIQKDHYLRARDIVGLERLETHRRIAWNNAQITEKDGKRVIRLPEELYGVAEWDAADELQDHIPITLVVSLRAEEGLLTVDFLCYHPRVSMSRKADFEAECFLYNDLTGASVPLPSETFAYEDLKTGDSALLSQDDYRIFRYHYAWCGARFVIDFDRLAAEDPDAFSMPAMNPGPRLRWIPFVRYKTPVSAGCRPLRGISAPAMRSLLELPLPAVTHGGTEHRYHLVSDLRQSLELELR